MEPISIRVLFFGRLTDLVSETEFVYSVPEKTTIADLYESLRRKNEDLPSREQDSSILVSINQCLASWEDELQSNDELAFLPPVTGG